jgi:hypothetical protein
MPRSLIRLISPTTKSCEDVHLLISKSVNSHSQNLKSDLCRCVLICSIYFLMCRLDETHKLIEVRSVMATQLRKDGSKKKPTWKDVAVTLAGLGFNRSPEQCSSMWSSLVKKYEVQLDSVPWMIIVDDFDSLGKQRLKAMICEPQLIHQSFRHNLCMP